MVFLEPTFCLLLDADPALVSAVLVDLATLDGGIDLGLDTDGVDSVGFEG